MASAAVASPHLRSPSPPPPLAAHDDTAPPPLDELPAASLALLASLLPGADLLRLAQTCRTLHAVAGDEALWKALCDASFWPHAFWRAPTWKASFVRRAALASPRGGCGFVLATTSRSGEAGPLALVAVTPFGVDAACAPVDAVVVAAVCSFGKTLVAVHPGGLQSFSPAPGGALASTGLVRFPRPAPFYTLLSACGGYAASLAPPPHEHTFGLFVTPTRAPAPHRLRPLTAGTPLFYAFSPAEDLIAAFVGAEELRLLPFSAEGLSPPPGAPAPAVFRWPLFRGGDGPAGAAPPPRSLMQAPLFTPDGRHVVVASCVSGEVRMEAYDVADMRAKLATTATAAHQEGGMGSGAPAAAASALPSPVALWRFPPHFRGPAHADAPQCRGGCGPDGAGAGLMSILEPSSGTLRVLRLPPLPSSAAAAASAAPIVFEHDAPTLLELRQRVALVDWQKAASRLPHESVTPPPLPPLLLLLCLDPHAHWAVFDPHSRRTLHLPRVRLLQQSAFANQFLPFANQMMRGKTLWSPAGDAFVFCGVAGGGVWVQRLVLPLWAPDGSDTLQPFPERVCDGDLVEWSP